MSGLRFHSHKTAMHEVFHVADGVHGGYLFLNGALLVVEELHLVREIEIVVDTVLVVVVFLR